MSIFSHFDASYGDGYFSSVPTNEGTDVFQTGELVHHHEPEFLTFKDGNLVVELQDDGSGQGKVFVNGQLEETRFGNEFGGENVYIDGMLTKVTVPNTHGGIDIYDGGMQHEGITFPNVFGGEDYLSTTGNANTMLSYQDPLAHAHEFNSNPFDITRG